MTTGFVFNDGGRAAAGFKGEAGDCVCRAIAIVTGRQFREIYDRLAAGTAGERRTRHSRNLSGRRTAREGIHTSRDWFKRYMLELGFTWHPTMTIGSGCTVHLCAEELPAGRLVVAVSKHYTAMIDGVIHDTHDPRRGAIIGNYDPATRRNIVLAPDSRCVYGYWRIDGVSQ